MDILRRKDRVFVLINIFIEGKLSPGRICLLILIYSVSLTGFCEGKENDGVFGQRRQGKRREGSFCCCTWAAGQERVPQSAVMITHILCPLYACKSSTRETGDSIYLANVCDRKPCITPNFLSGDCGLCPYPTTFSPCNIRWEPCDELLDS